MPIGLTGFRNRKMLTTTATAPLAFPSTCSVKGLVHFVTRKFVKFTENANAQFKARIKKNRGDSAQFSANDANASGSIICVAVNSTKSATGLMKSSKLSESSFSVSFVNSTP